MTVQEALAMPSFQDAQLVAGRSGLSNEVTSAMVLEATDIEHWGKEGQMLLTGYYALSEMTVDQLTTFFKKLSKLKISALVLKTDRLVYATPGILISLCDQYAIPLIQISRKTKYEPILLDVFGHILDSNLTLLNRFFYVHNQVSALALRQPSILQILHFLRRMIRQEATFYNKNEEIRISSVPPLCVFGDMVLTPIQGAGQYHNYRYFHAILTYEEPQNALAVAIPTVNNSPCYLIIHENADLLTAMDTMTIENVVSLLQMELLKQHAIDQKLFIRSNNLVDDLLMGRYNDKTQIDATLTDLGISSHPLYQVVLIHFDFREDLLPARREELIHMIRQRIKQIYDDLAFLQSNDSLVFIYNYASPRTETDLHRLDELVREVRGQLDSPEFHYLVGLSSCGDRYALDTLNQQVTDICKLFDTSNHRDMAMNYSDLGVYKLFIALDDPSQLERYLDPRIQTMRTESPDVLETLISYCENSLNYQETARKLYLHPKTVRYRIERADSVWGVDPHRHEDLLQVLLSARILTLLEYH